MADPYLERLQWMFGGGGTVPQQPRPVSGPMTPMQRAWSSGSALGTNLGLASQNMPRPVTGPMTPMQQQAVTRPNFTTMGGPRQVGGELGRAAPIRPNFTMPGPQFPVATQSYPSPAMASPMGVGAPNMAAGSRFMGNAVDATPRLPAPTATAAPMPAAQPGIAARMMGMLGSAGRAAMPVARVMGPVGAAVGLGSLASSMMSEPAAPQPIGPGGMNEVPPASAAFMPPMSVEEFSQMMGVQPQAPAPQMPMARPAPAPMMQQPAPAYQPPMTPVMEGQNANIGDDTRARAMAWLAQQGLR